MSLRLVLNHARVGRSDTREAREQRWIRTGGPFPSAPNGDEAGSLGSSQRQHLSVRMHRSAAGPPFEVIVGA